MSQVLTLGIPKGSLESATIDLFKRSGWRITLYSRNYFPGIDDPEIRCIMARAQEMSRFVEQGTLDVGLTGKDWTLENNSDVVVVTDLIYSKASRRPARWVLVVAKDSPVQRLEDLDGKKIYTELVQFTKRYFAEKDINVQVEFSWGATEAKIIEGLADAIVEVTETGSTIRANGLRVVEELLVTNTQLIANKGAWETPWKREKIEQIALGHGQRGFFINFVNPGHRHRTGITVIDINQGHTDADADFNEIASGDIGAGTIGVFNDVAGLN